MLDSAILLYPSLFVYCNYFNCINRTDNFAGAAADTILRVVNRLFSKFMRDCTFWTYVCTESAFAANIIIKFNKSDSGILFFLKCHLFYCTCRADVRTVFAVILTFAGGIINIYGFVFFVRFFKNFAFAMFYT